MQSIFNEAEKYHPCGYKHKMDLLRDLFGPDNIAPAEEEDAAAETAEASAPRGINLLRLDTAARLAGSILSNAAVNARKMTTDAVVEAACELADALIAKIRES